MKPKNQNLCTNPKCGHEKLRHMYSPISESHEGCAVVNCTCKKFVLREEGKICAKCRKYKETNEYWKAKGKLRSSCIPCTKKLNKDSFIICKDCNKKVKKKSTSHKYCNVCIKRRDLESNHRWLDVHRRDKDYIFKMASRLKAQRKIKIPKEQVCQKCNKNKAIERHHEDYNKPLKVLFVCSKCHNKIHTGVKK